MVQIPLQRPDRLRVIDDLGPVGGGASAARYVVAENGTEYIIKGPSLSSNHANVAANELIAASLARQLGLPVLDYCIVEMRGDLYFASTRMDGNSFYPAITFDLLNRCINRDRIYDLVIFDLWLCNIDRHAQNLIVRSSKAGANGAKHYSLLLNDHSHCLGRVVS